MVGTEYEQRGIIKHGALMINAVSNSTVPHLTVNLGASYGAGNYGMCGRAYEPRFLFTWPNAKSAVMGPAAAGRGAVHRGPAGGRGQGAAATTRRPTRRCGRWSSSRSSSSRPRCSMSGRLYDDGVIDPRDTRTVLGLCLSADPQRHRSRAPTASASSGCEGEPMITQTAGGQPGRDRPPGLRHLPARWASRRSPSTPTPTPTRRTSREADHAVRLPGDAPAETYLRVDLIVARPRAGRRGRGPPRLRLPRRERRLRRGGDRRRADLGRPAGQGDRGDGLEVEAKALLAEAGRADAADAGPTPTEVDRLPGAGQGVRRRRRPGHADRRATPTTLAEAVAVGPARGGRRVRRRHGLLRAVRRDAAGTSRCRSSPTRHGTVVAARRAGVLDPAPAPEDRRGGAVAGGRRRAAASSCARRRSRRPGRSATSAPARSSSCSPRTASSSSWR